MILLIPAYFTHKTEKGANNKLKNIEKGANNSL